MENVKNFATHDEGRTLAVVKATMEELGYTFYQKVLNAVDYGVPQKRERIYMVCFRNDLNGIAITLSAYGGGVFAKTGGYLVNGKTRKLHPRECARIMGYPDSYKICESNNQAYKQFGNSVVIDVLQYIGQEIGETLK